MRRRLAPFGASPAVRVEEARAERGHRAGAAVVGRAAAEGERNVGVSGVQRVRDQLARPVGRGGEDVAAGFVDQRQPAGRRRFDDGAAAVRDAVERVDGAAERVVRAHGNRSAAGRGQDGRHAAFAAVGHRDAAAVAVGEGGAGAFAEHRADFRRGERALERIGGKDEFHRVICAPRRCRARPAPPRRRPPGRCACQTPWAECNRPSARRPRRARRWRRRRRASSRR